MSWDELGYNLSPFLGPIGQGIAKFSQDSRLADELRKLREAKTLEDFATVQPANNLYDPSHIGALEKFREGRKATLEGEGAAPVVAEANRLNRMAANDPYIGSAEGLQDFAERPGFWLGQSDTGVVLGAKKGTMATESGYNPRIAETVQNFGTGNQNILDAFRVTNNMPQARLMQNKDLSNNYKDVQAGAENQQQIQDLKAKPTEAAKGQKNLADFMSSVSMLNTPSERTGKLMPFGEAAELINQAAADYPVEAQVANNATDNLLQQYKESRKPTSGKTGRTTWTGTVNELGDINKDVASVAPVTNVFNSVAQTSFVDPATGKPLVFDKNTQSYRVANIEGGGGVTPKPNAMSPEAATRAQQFDTVIANVPKIRDMVFNKNGEINRIDVANASVGTPFTKGREIRQTVKRTVEQVLRIATGAAAPDSEVKNYTDMYSPQIGDTKEMINNKLKALNDFAEGARTKYNIGRSPQAVNGGVSAAPVHPSGVMKFDKNGKRIQ